MNWAQRWIVILPLFVAIGSMCHAQDSILVTGTIGSVTLQQIERVDLTVGTETVTIDSEEFDFRCAVGKPTTFSITAVNHQPESFVIYDTSSDSIHVNIRLATNLTRSPIKSVMLISNGARGFWMKGDGSEVYTVRVPTTNGQLRYQLQVVQESPTGSSHSFNGTMHDSLVNDDGGDFLSVINRDSDSVTVTFDPTSLPRSKSVGSIQFNSVEVNRLNAVLAYNAELGAPFWMRLRALQSDSTARLEYIREVNQQGQSALEGVIDMPESPLRDALIARALIVADITPRYEDVLETEWVDDLVNSLPMLLPPDSPAWNLAGYSTGFLTRRLDSATVRTYLHNLAEQNLDYEYRPYLFRDLIKYYGRSGTNKAELEGLLAKLNMEYPNHEATKSVNSEYGSARAIQVGQPVPSFSFSNISDSSSSITDESIRGKYTLVDVWATWCKPCIEEMPNLRAAYDRFNSKNFQILSVSVDRAATLVQDYWASTSRTPWLNAYSSRSEPNGAMQIFEVHGIPKVFLVGPDGKIIKTENDLRGEKLIKTLSIVLE